MVSYFEKNFVFYLSYHNNSTNQWIHIFCVWPILWTGQMFLSYADLPFAVAGHTFSVAQLLSAIYILLYLFIEQPGVAGPIAAALVAAGQFLATKITASQPDIWKIATAVHVFCWVAQIYGHQVFEKRAPAFLDNLFQAFFMAPIFVLMEVLFSFGYKKDFKKRMIVQAVENIAKFRSENAKKSS